MAAGKKTFGSLFSKVKAKLQEFEQPQWVSVLIVRCVLTRILGKVNNNMLNLQAQIQYGLRHSRTNSTDSSQLTSRQRRPQVLRPL